MKYNKIVKENVGNKNSYLMACVCSILLLIAMCYFGANGDVKGTNASFGGITGTITVPCNITYSSNWPDSSQENEIKKEQAKKTYVILDNMFTVPEGYKFIGWNTMSDGTGDMYTPSQNIPLTDDIELYAQWTLNEEDDTEDEPNLDVINYGDVNNDGKIDESDSLLVENHILGTGTLSDDALSSADVNADGSVNEVDVDIIKQVYLGTDGYVGYLPGKPVPIYTVYEGNSDNDDGGTGSDNDSSSDNDTEDKDGNDSSDNVDNNSNSGTGSGNNTGGTGSGGGTGTGGSGSGSSGNSGGNNSGNTSGGGSGSSSSGNNSGSSNNGSSNKDNDEDDTDNNDVDISIPEVSKVYEFKFMVDNIEYASTKCDVLTDGTCELIFPNDKPSKSGYTFKGWSLKKECSNEKDIIASLVVNSSNTYYACFMINTNVTSEDKFPYTVVTVILVWVIAIGGIVYTVKRFKNKGNSD